MFLKDLEQIHPDYRDGIRDKIMDLGNDPRPIGYEKLKGSRSMSVYRIRYGIYRVVYKIFDDKLLVMLIAIGHRKEIYKK